MEQKPLFTALAEVLSTSQNVTFVVQKDNDQSMTVLVKPVNEKNVSLPSYIVSGTPTELDNSLQEIFVSPISKAVGNLDRINYYDKTMKSIEDAKSKKFTESTAKKKAAKKPSPTPKKPNPPSIPVASKIISSNENNTPTTVESKPAQETSIIHNSSKPTSIVASLEDEELADLYADEGSTFEASEDSENHISPNQITMF